MYKHDKDFINEFVNYTKEDIGKIIFKSENNEQLTYEIITNNAWELFSNVVNIYQTEKNKKYKLPKNFDHSIDKKTKNKIINMLKNRYTIKQVSEKLNVSTSTISRVKKENGLTKPRNKKNEKSEK